MNVKTYNVGAYGIPAAIVSSVAKLGVDKIPLEYSRHAMQEAIHDQHGVLPASAFPKVFQWSDNWTLVEAEANDIGVTKFVVRRAVDSRRSMVLVIAVGFCSGLVKTLWTNLNSDGHATLNKSNYAKP